MELVEELNDVEGTQREVQNLPEVVDQYMASCPVSGWWSGGEGDDEGLLEPWWMEGELEQCEDMDMWMQRIHGPMHRIVKLDHNYSMEVDVADTVSVEEEEADNERDATELLQGGVITKDIVEVKRAIRLGANVDERMAAISLHETPIMRASRGDNVECIDVLIRAGANVNCVDAEGKTALMLAARASSYRAVQLLLEAGSDVNAVDRYGKTALMGACDYRECIEFCLRCLHTEPRRMIAEAIVDAGGNVNALDREQNTALILACKSKQPPEMIEFLLDAGVEINRSNYFGMNALMHAVCRDAYEITAMLLSRGVDVEQVNFFGESATDFVSVDSEDSINVAIMLMRGGAKLNDNIIEASVRLQVQRDRCREANLRLTHLCREKIRGCMMYRCAGGRIRDLVRHLPLPISVREFVADSTRFILDV